ncbi:hypothetical protein CCL09_14695 [Pseudomonas congelans]|nr:hypothetical protein CCL09_14695 [Pseudomonas congelans]
MQFVTLCVTQRFCDVRWIGVRLRSPRPDFVEFLRPVTYVALCVVSAIVFEKHFRVVGLEARPGT